MGYSSTFATTLDIQNVGISSLARCVGKRKVFVFHAMEVNSSSYSVRQEWRRGWRKKKSPEDRTQPDSHANISLLSPETLQNRLVNTMRDVVRSCRKQLYRLELRLHENVVIDREDKGLVDVLRKAFHDSSNSDADKLKQSIVEVLVASSEDASKQTNEKVRVFAGQVVQTMNHYAMKLQGKDKQIQCDLRITRTALGLWLRSPANFEFMKSNSIEIFPSERTLYRLQKKLKQEEGRFAKVYGWFRDERQHKKTDGRNPSIVAILADELLTLKTDMYCNFRTRALWRTCSHS